jgi:phage baseplate assembly protein W
MASKRYYSIKFPFTAKASEGFYLDLASDAFRSMKQDLTHLLFTPTGQKLRDPAFGCSLARMLFNPMDDMTFGDIKIEMQSVVSRYFPNVSISLLEVTPNDDSRGVTVRIAYDVREGNYSVRDEIVQVL